MTSLDAPTPARRRLRGFAAQRIGLRLFGRNDITGMFADAGLVDIEQRLRGVTQYVNATKPL